MAARTVRSTDGRTWTVRRRWLPRLGTDTLWARFRRRVRGTLRRTGDTLDLDPGCAVDIGEGIGLAVLVIIAILLLVFAVIPVLVALVDLVILLLLLLAGGMARVLLRRPWVVEASAEGASRLRWRVEGWRASGARRDEVAALREAGIVPPPGID